MKRPVKILIADWIPSLNKGELSIFLGILNSFKKIGYVEVSIFSLSPEVDGLRYPDTIGIVDIARDLHIRMAFPERPRVDVIIGSFITMLQHLFFGMLHAILGKHALKIMRKNIWKQYCRSDVIIICHDQVSVVHGSDYTLFFPLYGALLAKSLKKPVVIYGNGTYKLGSIFWERLATILLRNVDLTTLREQASFNYLTNLAGKTAPIYLTAEPAILMSPVDYETANKILEIEGISGDQCMLIGMTLTRSTVLSAYNSSESPEERYNKAVVKFANLLDTLTNTVNAQVVFFPHSIEPYRKLDDREVARDVAAQMKNKQKIILITKEYSPQELKGLMGKFDIFVGSRIHSIVNALCMNVPTITLTRSRSMMRADGIIGGTLGQSDWIYVVDDFKQNDLLAKILLLLSTRDEVRKKLTVLTKDAYSQAMLNGILLNVLLQSQKDSAL